MPLISDFNQQCTLTADKIAFIEGDRQLSYHQVQQQIQKISARLQYGKSACQRVAIALDRGIDAAIAILATLNAGACYIPLELKNPHGRLRYIINDAQPHYVLGHGECPDWIEDPQLWIAVDQLEDLPPVTGKTIDPENLAAILYTSGSTGNPKGVALSHRALENFVDWAAETFNIDQHARIASLAPFHFDLSVFDLFAGLTRGASIHFVPAALTLSPSRLTAWLAEQKITVWYTVPSLLSFLSLKGGLSTNPLPDLTTLLFAGEVFPTAQLIKLCTQLEHVNFYNLYGPTETNVCCYWPVQRDRLKIGQNIPIGIPAADALLKIADDNGELLVHSQNNLSGYWQQGKLQPACNEEGFYATGDKVSRNEYGEYCYHGRLDRMMKCSGYRVEPAEIEQAILQHNAVTHCAVVPVRDSTSGHRPAAAVVLNNPDKLAELVKFIKQSLPAYMHPCKFKVLDALPYLANGKIDYQAVQQQLENQ